MGEVGGGAHRERRARLVAAAQGRRGRWAERQPCGRERGRAGERKEGREEKKKRKTDIRVPRLVVGIEYEIERMTGAKKLNVKERISTTRTEYFF